MDRVTKFKEAVKTALALALVYGIALKAGWMNPYWAGWAVAMIALPTAGQSIHWAFFDWRERSPAVLLRSSSSPWHPKTDGCSCFLPVRGSSSPPTWCSPTRNAPTSGTWLASSASGKRDLKYTREGHARLSLRLLS